MKHDDLDSGMGRDELKWRRIKQSSDRALICHYEQTEAFGVVGPVLE
jgi:hypothetical protein